MTKTGKIALALGFLVVAGGAAWWWRAGGQEAIVAANVPATPAVDASAPAVLWERLAAAEARAGGRFTAAAGLAELSRLYHANGFLTEAAQCYDGLEKLFPREPRWLHRHATILAGFGQVEPALERWRRALELAPDYLPARLRLGDCLLKANRAAEATAAFQEVLKRDATNAYAQLGLARLDFEAGRWGPARERLEAVVRQTNYALGYDLIVSLYEKIGEQEKARAIRGSAKASGAYRDLPDPWVDELMDVCFDPYRLALAAGVLAQSGNLAGAEGLLNRALELAPDDVAVIFQLGGIAESRRDLAAAAARYEQCTILSPEFADGWAHLADVQARSGQAAASERTVLAGLVKCPDSPGLHLMRARSLRDAGRTTEAIAEFQNAIRLRPNEPDAYVDLGQLYLQVGNDAAAVQQMRRAYEADPGDPMALSVLAFSAITANREPEARQWLERIAHQPRVQAQYRQQVLDMYRQTFGRAFAPQ